MKNGHTHHTPGSPGGMRAYLQNLKKNNSLLKHLADSSVKGTHPSRSSASPLTLV